jgi:hypothetical protein
MKFCIATGRLSRANSAGKSVQSGLILRSDQSIICKIVPHVTDAIQDWIERVSKIPVDETGEEPDLCIVEVCSTAVQLHALLLSQVVSSGEPLAISSPRPS